MSRLILLFCLASALPSMAAEPAYRIVHPDGTVEFTDEAPSRGGETIRLQPVPTYESAPLSPPVATGRDAQGPAESPEDRALPTEIRVHLTRPRPEETFWATQWEVPASVAVQPALPEGHAVVLILDGQVVARGKAGSYTLKPVYRGPHQLRAAVVGPNDRQLTESEPVTFFVHKHTINRP